MQNLTVLAAAAALLCSMGTAFGTSNSKSVDSLNVIREGFTSPSAEYRALPMCSFDYSQTQEHVKALVKAGWGGVNMQYPDWGQGYLLSEESWAKYQEAIAACKENNLAAWIYDERGYPSGKAGFLVLKDHPEYEAQGLFYSSSDFSQQSAGSVECKIPEGTPFYIALFHLDGGKLSGKPVDLTASARDGVVRTVLEPGTWRIVAFVSNALFKGTHSEVLGERYVNLMDPEATRRFLDITHEAYYTHSKDAFGKTVKAFFTDEPSLMGGYLVDATQPYPVLSWYHGLPAEFRTDSGYDIREALPSLFNDTGADTVRKRSDVYRTIARVTANNYFGQIRRWCEAHGVASGGHLVWEESLIYHANFYGNIMTSLAELDLPGIDLLGCNYGCTSGSRTEGGPVTPKLISSSAHLHGRERTCTESFCFVKKDLPLEDMLAEVAWQWVLGINTLTTLSTQQEHSPEQHRKLNEYTGRLSYMLTRGKFAADVAVLYPIASVWADFHPTNRGVWNFEDNPGAQKVDEVWQQTTRELLACQRDFDYVDESDVERAVVSKRGMKVGDCRYSILVLPHVTTLRQSALQQIVRFVEAGGTVISCGAIPTNREDAGPASEFRNLVDRLWKQKPTAGRVIQLTSLDPLQKTLAQLGSADVSVSPGNRDIYYQHRSLPSSDIYFLINNSKQPISADVTFRATGKAEIWDPMTGEAKQTSAQTSKGRSTIALTVPARNGVFVVFDKGKH